MKNNVMLAVIVLIVGYLAFEGYVGYKVKHRFEPAYIHDMMIKAQTAVSVCSRRLKPAPDTAGFDRVLARVTRKYRDALAEQSPGKDVAIIGQELADKVASIQGGIKAHVAEKTCDDQDVKDHLRRFDIYARKG